ncbi:MAG: hypothetical protein IJA62_02525 [Ruminococcus sp.]|nr:hypothetical protein [Ruminococcus sp.]
MKIVRIPVLKKEKKLPVIMIIIAAFMFLISIFDITFVFKGGAFALSISTVGFWSSILSIIPLSWGLCTGLLLKFKKANFAKIPAYITCALIGIGFALYMIVAGQKNPVTSILLFSLAVLLIYPFIISTLTLEGRLYNRVFATIFSSILLAICTIGAIVYFVLKGAITLTFLIPALMYVELLLIVLCFRLEKPQRKKENNMITH